MRMNFIDTHFGDFNIPIGSGYFSIMSKEYTMELGDDPDSRGAEIQVEPGTYTVTVEIDSSRGSTTISGPITTDLAVILGDPYHIVSANGWVLLMTNTKLLSEPPKGRLIAHHLGVYTPVDVKVNLSRC